MDTNQIVCNGCLSKVPADAPKCPYCGHSFANTNPAGTLPAGMVLAARYTLGKCISIDGEGVSYAAADAQTQRHVVIKEYVPVTICAARTRAGAVLSRPETEVLFKTTRMDFVDLYRTLISVGPMEGLVRIYDLFEANNTAYAVQEPNSGVPLLRYLKTRRAPLTPAEAVSLLRPVMYGVEAMHRKGILHRGISPETIYISAEGRAKLSGYATLGLRTADSELRSQLYDGYAAPEQYAVAEFDGKYTDVYGLGGVFYRAITGVAPQAADHRRINDTLEMPRNVVSTIPLFVSNALMRALRMPSAERIQTAPELMQALTVPAPKAKLLDLTTQQKKYVLLGGIVLLVVFILSLAVLLGSGKKEPVSSLPETSSVSAVPEVETIVLPSFRGKQYSEVQQNFLGTCLFITEEEFNSEFVAGEIISQSPLAGVEVEVGTVVTLVVSRGPETILMPEVLNKPRTEVKATLDSIGIKYDILELANDGSYQADTIVKSDVAAGTPIDPAKDRVILYVAKEAPQPDTQTEDKDKQHGNKKDD